VSLRCVGSTHVPASLLSPEGWQAPRLLALDRGMVSEENLRFLRKRSGVTSSGHRRHAESFAPELRSGIGSKCGKAWRCAGVPLLVARKYFFSAGARRGKRKSRPGTSGSRNGLRRAWKRSWPAAESENNCRPSWGSASGDCWARTHERRERLQ